MYSFNKRLKQLFVIDTIRLCKFLEIFQYSFVFLILTFMSVFLLNKYYYRTKKVSTKKVTKKNKKKILKAFWSLFIDTFLIIIIFFFIRKVALLMPSIATLIYPPFEGLTTLEYIIHISLVVVLIESLPQFKEKIIELGKVLNPYSFANSDNHHI